MGINWLKKTETAFRHGYVRMGNVKIQAEKNGAAR